MIDSSRSLDYPSFHLSLRFREITSMKRIIHVKRAREAKFGSRKIYTKYRNRDKVGEEKFVHETFILEYSRWDRNSGETVAT